MKGRVLVTGYEPFGGSRINPSGQAALALDGEVVAGYLVVGRVLPVVYQQAVHTLASLVEEFQPAVVVMSGQSGRPDIAIEKVAVNVSGPGSDNAGNDPHEEPVVVGGPAAYFTTLPITAILHNLHESGIPASISYTAGTYLCNHVFYGALHYLREWSIPVGFLHVPSLPEQKLDKSAASMSQDMITQALSIAVRVAVTTTGPPLHRWRERTELLLQEHERSRLAGSVTPSDFGELLNCGELEETLAWAQGEEAGRLRMLHDFVVHQRQEPLRKQARSLVKKGDYIGAIKCLPPDHMATFAQRGGAELLPFAERAVAQTSDLMPFAQSAEEEEPWARLLPAHRVREALEQTLEAMGLQNAPLQLEPSASLPQAGLSDQVWLKLAPAAGWSAYYENFYAAGQALHLAHFRTGLPWEYRRLGDAATLAASGLLLGGLLYDELWLEWILGRPCDREMVAFLAAKQAQRWRKAAGLVLAYQQAQMVENKVDHWEQKMAPFVECIIQATSSNVSPAEAIQIIIDWEETLVGFRALLFERALRGQLVVAWGDRWWQQTAAGHWLQQLWQHGLQSEEWWMRIT